MILNCSYWEGLKLRKLFINDWVYVFPRVALGDGGGGGGGGGGRWGGGGVVGRWNDMYLFGGFLLGGSNTEKWGDHRTKNFFINNFVGLLICDGLIETVKYIWVNIWCILGWIFSQNCRNSLPSHTADQLAKRTKS